MLAHLEPSSAVLIAMLAGCFVLVLAFEVSNGFHDTANAVATVIYTNSLKPVPAVVWSGLCNFAGVLLGGIAVAYALVEILPPDVLTPPDGSPAVPMLVAIFVSALAWNVVTWFFGVPNSSSHCVIGALVGVAVGDALLRGRDWRVGVDWHQVVAVLEGLALSPLLGAVLAGGLYGVVRLVLHKGPLVEPLKEGETPVAWLRGLLVLTCTGVSFAHGTNDGQKSIGLIMLTIIGLMPATFAINPEAGARPLGADARAAAPLIERYGDDQKAQAVAAAGRLAAAGTVQADGSKEGKSGLRGNVYLVLSELKRAEEGRGVPKADRAEAARLHQALGPPVQYAPWWVRVLSAACLGAGTMVGYKRIVRTLGERLGKQHMTPGQGACTEVVGAALIGVAGFSGLPVSTTHVITSGVAGTMVAGGQGVQAGMLVRIGLAWVLTLPVTMGVAGVLFYVLANPRF